MKPFHDWTVLPHGALTQLDEGVLTVTGKMHMPPMGDVDRRMTIAKLADGGLVIYSAIALDEPQMKEIERLGRPAYLVVPSAIHRMDVKIWKDRFPAMKVVTPPGAREAVEKIVPVDATSIDFGDPRVRYLVVPGTAEREAALLIDGPDGTTLVLNDLIFDLANRPGLTGWLFEKLGMTGEEPHMPGLIKMRLVKDERALAMALESWARLPALKRIVISHGPVVCNDASGVLRRIAHDLAA